MAWAYPGSRAYFLLSRCVSRCAAVSPCIAVVTDIWRTESGRSKRFPEPLAPGFRRPTVLGEEPARRPEDHWWSDVVAPAWLKESAGSRENPADIGVAPWTGRNCVAWRRDALFALPRRAAGRARLACRMQRLATDEPAPSWPASRQYPLTSC